jgi:hypothetical protein
MDSIELQLKELVLDDDFTSLQSLVNEEVNLMEILKVSHRELQHSNFLAWFFNPNESHNLGDYALKEFIKIYFRENQFQNFGNGTGLSVFDFVHLDFDDLEIRREYKNIDLIFLSKKNQFCIVIENKIYARESNGQLAKYRRIVEGEYADFKHKIYIFLSLEEQLISEAEQDYYVQLTYDHIIKLIEQVLNSQKLNLGDKTRFVFEQYLQTLKSMLNKNEEIEKIAQQLYKKYKSAFDLVMKYSDVAVGGIESWQYLKNLIDNERTIEPTNHNKAHLRFRPRYFRDNLDVLKSVGLVAHDDDLSNNLMFEFVFKLVKDEIYFYFVIGTGDQGVRERLYKMCANNPDTFNLMNKSMKVGLRRNWHRVFEKQILTQEDYDTSQNIDPDKLIKARFQELMDNDIPKMIDCIDREIKKIIRV